MIKNFDEVKQQLRELAEIVNAFKSETVQLRIVDLIFSSAGSQPTPHAPHSETTKSSQQTTPRKRKSRNGETAATGSPKSARGRLGARAALSKMYGEGFFKDHNRTISDVVNHAETNMAAKLKSTDLSGPLARYTRDKKLTRSKNADNQYEYTQA